MAASPESQGTYKSHTKVTEIHHGQNTLTFDPTRQNKANQTIKQANSRVLHWPEPGKLLVRPSNTPPERSPGEKARGKGSAGLRCLCQPQCQAPCAAPTDLLRARHAGAAPPAPSPFPKWAQRQVKSELTRATSWSALQFQSQIRENLFLGLFLLNHKSQSIARVADYLTERFPKNFAGM